MSRTGPLYTPAGVALGTLLGTLAGGAALLWLNYRALGHRRLANKVAAIGLAGYLLVVTVASVLPDDPWLGAAFVILQTWLAYHAARLLQGDAVHYHLARGVAAQPMLRAAGIGFLTGIGVILLLMMVASLVGSTLPAELAT